ncbi:hypothetical protein EJB05_41036 [Eragrostis curvula]|uniref:histone acetyltransferase n=1 Tax=Eragrostis curvula TaxID=38414 RepID=A0A5J9TAR9_9POAL|nr:hypothetical protein EJB05_41036 [Eragrostis curvula]
MNKWQEANLSEMSGQHVQMNLSGGRHQQQQVALGHQQLHDPQFRKMRMIMHGRIVDYLREKKNAAEQSLEKLASRLENEMYRLHPTKDDYYVMLKEPTEQLVRAVIKVLSTHGHQRQKMLNQTQSSSIYGTMAPTPGSMSNGYGDPSTNCRQNPTTSSVNASPATCPVSMQRQVTHMIPTPGFNNQQTLPADPEYLHAGYLNGELDAVPQVQQKQQKSVTINESTSPVQQLNHFGSGVHLRMLEKSSSYDLSDAQINDGIGSHGRNKQLTNRVAASESSISIPSYGIISDKALKPESQTTKQSLQLKLCKNAKELDKMENVSFRKSKSSQGQLLQRQHQLKSNLLYSQYVQNQGALEATEDNETRDQISGKLDPRTHIRVTCDSQNLLSPHVTNTIFMSNEIQNEFCHKTMSQDGAREPLSSYWLHAGCTMNSVDPKLSKIRTNVPEQTRETVKGYYRQVRWLLLLIHAKSCPSPLGSCNSQFCVHAQDIWKHFNNCQRKDCSYKYCRQSKMVMYHYKNCVNKHCPVCSKAKESLCRCSKQTNKRSHAEPILIMEPSTVKRISDGVHGDRMDIDLGAIETLDDQPPVSKRMRQSLSPNGSGNVHSPVPQTHSGFVLNKRKFLKQELNMKTDMHPPGVASELDSHVEREKWLSDKDTNENVRDIKDINACTDALMSKTGKTKTKGISLMEFFTPEQVYDHILSLRQWVGQSKAKAEKNQAIGHSGNENACQLCKVERLTFEPPPIYCSPCGSRIKRNAPYYVGTISESGRYNFCAPCYNESRIDSIFVDSIQFLKSKLEKKRNNDELEEAWVACDKCKRWQHQICALFNAKRNEEEEAEFTCHDCYIQEIKHGLRVPLLQNNVLGAKDLPRTLLSNHLEERIFQRLKEERQARAEKIGKKINEVPGAEGLVVRVVSSVDKKLEVKPQFLEIFQEENYPTEFPYKSKAILLFQRIEGVEVCIFAMYVQEFGTECAFPNQRRVYLSYLDSVKYFRPEIETVSGEALRTFVYHEILIGYLQYCKQRGFTSCYIWACPPLKGEDYIMYCHPEIQKTPKSDKLREWYLSMLQKAIKEGIVVELTNLYDHFFVPKRECKAKVTAARLPYFDGDYWPGAAEDMINQIRLSEGDRNLQKKGKMKNTITKRDLKAAGITELSGNASKDAMLMQKAHIGPYSCLYIVGVNLVVSAGHRPAVTQSLPVAVLSKIVPRRPHQLVAKLGEFIYPMKEDFIMVHLQYSCSHCSILMVSGRRWECNQCKNFHICDKCYNIEQQCEEKDKHPSNSRDIHTLHEVEIIGVPEDTKDRDNIIESEFFDTRQAFLSLCQGNHYQYDTLRNAKHSSMMVLHHLHNPTEPAFVTTCNACENDIKTGQVWRCKECDYDECTACYQKHGGANHAHTLTKHPAGADKDIQTRRQKFVEMARIMQESLAHAVKCRASPRCQYPFCRKLKLLFLHGSKCQERASGGCPLCKKVWGIIHFHVRICKESQCKVPRCRDLKEFTRRLQRQSESRRRAAVNEMMRQRAAESGVNQ